MTTVDKELDLTIYEDIAHLGDLIDRAETRNSDIRNSVHILRRLLIQGDLQKSANSRRYKLSIVAPELKPYIQATRNGLINFYLSGGAKVLGIYVKGLVVSRGDGSRLNQYFVNHQPDQSIELSIQSFLRQQCSSIREEFVTRQDVINYVSNKAGNSHFDRRGRNNVLDRIRAACSIGLDENDVPSIAVNIDAVGSSEFSFDPNPRKIDPLFFEVVSTATYLVSSPSIQSYVETLRSEYGF